MTVLIVLSCGTIVETEIVTQTGDAGELETRLNRSMRLMRVNGVAEKKEEGVVVIKETS